MGPKPTGSFFKLKPELIMGIRRKTKEEESIRRVANLLKVSEEAVRENNLREKLLEELDKIIENNKAREGQTDEEGEGKKNKP